MAFQGQQPLVDGGRPAGADLFESQFRFVKLNSDGEVIAVADANDDPYGVLQNAPREGEAALVCLVGITKLVSSATLAPAATVGTSANGRAASGGTLGFVIDGGAADEVITAAVSTLCTA